MLQAWKRQDIFTYSKQTHYNETSNENPAGLEWRFVWSTVEHLCSIPAIT